MPGLFVTATGTDVGKTYVTSGLLRAGRRAGLAMRALKPVLTGYKEDENTEHDAGVLLDALGLAATPEAVAQIAPFRFAAPLAPNMAAEAEGRGVDFAALVTTARAAIRHDALTIVEGIGGVMVPFDDCHTVLDLIAALALPVVLVTSTGLGALSHCLTACVALDARGCTPSLLVLNETPGSTVPLAATRETLATFLAPMPTAIVTRHASNACFDALLRQVLTAIGAEYP